ncbi:MAG: hypothetical protein AAGD25_37600 [Cyanobacteria bacterium P01_F01_bin.150]
MEIFQELDRLKTQLDALRPLDPDLLKNLREVYTVRLTHHSTAIEGNTLTESETQIVLDKGITIGGKTLQEHLEVVNHASAIDFIRDLAKEQEPISEWTIRQVHGLVCKGNSLAGAYRAVNVMAAGTNYRYPNAIKVPDLMAEFCAWLCYRRDGHTKRPSNVKADFSIFDVSFGSRFSPFTVDLTTSRPCNYPL